MKILMLSIDGNIFDKDSYVRKRIFDYAKHLEKLTVLVAGKAGEEISFENVSIIPLTGPKIFLPILLFFRGLKEMGKLGKRDALITSQDPFFLGFVGIFLSKVSGAPLHTQVHVDFSSSHYKNESRKQKLGAMLASFVLRNSKRIRPVSEKIRSFIEATLKIPEEQIDVIPLLVDVEKIRKAEISEDLHALYPEFGKIVLMACRLSKQKNIPLALRVLKRVKEKFPDTGLVIVGKGSEEGVVRREIKNLELQDNVRILPWTNNVASLMKTADAFLLSSNYEGYVMTAMEASLCGAPVVMTDVGGAGEYIKDGVNGVIVPIEDEEALSNALMKVLGDEAFREQIITGAKESAARLPSYEEYVRRIIDSWAKTLR